MLKPNQIHGGTHITKKKVKSSSKQLQVKQHRNQMQKALEKDKSSWKTCNSCTKLVKYTNCKEACPVCTDCGWKCQMNQCKAVKPKLQYFLDELQKDKRKSSELQTQSGRAQDTSKFGSDRLKKVNQEPIHLIQSQNDEKATAVFSIFESKFNKQTKTKDNPSS